MADDPRKRIQAFILAALKTRLDQGELPPPVDTRDLAEKVGESLVYLRFLPFAIQLMEVDLAQGDRQQNIDLNDLSKMVADEIHVALSEYYSPILGGYNAFFPQQLKAVPYN
jgi:hypothetical protein